MNLKNLFFAWLMFVGSMTFAQNLKSPVDFLGYDPGEKFTPHHKIIEYFEHAASAAGEMVRLERYGYSYEGKPLMIAVVGSSQNMRQIDKIRMNNLAMAGMADRSKITDSGPVIVWLSYNVHGNEASSSEVSMKVLFELLSMKNGNVKKWLANTIVIIDPCLNPDGRDRYVNWYNGIAGSKPDPDPGAAEHDEPWPSGRGNHYYFDLNRDWAWQSQTETRLRVAKYNEWMPAIHVDFHEQYPGNPYYFAPAAEPFHEVITPWQRSFQNDIGRNHAKYFDANGWLYFTREYFDLFYPAYGDTYPIYNGSIGMTYEQAGHGVAGLAIKTGDDTLTLSQRVEHHYTTSLSTIEMASANAERLNREFMKYFDEGRQKGYGAYKTYILRPGSKAAQAPLIDLLKVNGIQWSYASEKLKPKGYNYFTGKEETFQVSSSDIIISALQAKSALVKVLFEPDAILPDSSTYDITAWSLPFAFGMQAWAVREKIIPSSVVTGRNERSALTDAYGYLLAYDGFESGRLMAHLLQSGVKLRFTEKELKYKGLSYAPGTLIILKKGNEAKMDVVREANEKFNARLVAVSSGFMESGVDFGSDKVRVVKKPKVALVTGDGCNSTAVGEVWHFFEQQLQYPLTRLKNSNPSSWDLKNIDVIVLASGSYEFLADKESGAALKSWVAQGGKLIAMEQAVSQMAKGEWGIKKKKEEDEEEKSSYADIKKFGSRDRDGIVDHIPGAIYRVELDNSHPLAFGYPDYYFTLKQNADLYEFMKDGWNVGVIKKTNPVSGFVGSNLKQKLQDGTVMATQSMGRGTIVYFADDPLFRSFWENGKLLFVNAVFLAGN